MNVELIVHNASNGHFNGGFILKKFKTQFYHYILVH